jgi:hypothetical protein
MLFYVSAIPLSGLPEPRSEGAYLLVNKNLIEAAAVLVVSLFSRLPDLPDLPVNSVNSVNSVNTHAHA